jgi:hypothetical protein
LTLHNPKFNKDVIEMIAELEKVFQGKELRLCLFAIFDVMCTTYRHMYSKEEDGKIRVW